MNWDRSWTRRVAASMIIAVLACVLPQAAAAETVPLPSGAASGAGQDADLPGISCPAGGECTAVGWYYDTSGNAQALLELQNAGTWTATQVNMASLPSVSASPDGGFYDVSCTSPGNCAAVGSYLDAGNDEQGLIDTETDGSWSVSELPLGGLPNTSGNPAVELHSVACPASGQCLAVGDYQDSSGHEQALIAVESGGTWVAHRADLTALSTYSNPYARLTSVACSSVGNCAAAGSYRDSSDDTEGLLATETSGAWVAARPDVSHIADAQSPVQDGINAIACPAAGGCTAVGYYRSTAGFNRPMLLSQSAGSWGPASEAQMPGNADPTNHQNAELSSLACPASGDCTAVGDYAAASSTIGGQQPFAVTETAGAWGGGAELSMPAGASANPRAYMLGLACSGPGSCLAAGRYDDTSGANGVLVAQLSAGGWSTAGVPQPSTNGLFPVADGAVSCTGAGYCAVSGATLSWASSSSYVPYLLDAPQAISGPSVGLSGTTAQLSWTGPADDGGLAVSGFEVTASDLTQAARGGQTASSATDTATIAGLTPGDTYTFTITPRSLLGTGLPATTAAVTVPVQASVKPPTFSDQQLTAALSGLLTPAGPASRLRRLRRTHSYTFHWQPLEAGTVTVRWFVKTGKGKHRRTRLIASGRATAGTTAPVNVKVTLNRLGRRLIKLGKRLRVTATVKFTSGATSVSLTHTFALH